MATYVVCICVACVCVTTCVIKSNPQKYINGTFPRPLYVPIVLVCGGVWHGVRRCVFAVLRSPHVGIQDVAKADSEGQS